jgi:hypothetical protein
MIVHNEYLGDKCRCNYCIQTDIIRMFSDILEDDIATQLEYVSENVDTIEEI